MKDSQNAVHWTIVALAVTIALIIFSMGEFELLEILRIKRVVQILLLGSVVVFAAVVRLQESFHAALLDPLFLIAITFLATEILIYGNPTRILEMAVTAVLLVYIICMGPRFVAHVVKFVITLAGIFACMALLQFLILVAFPHLLPGTVISDMNPTGGDEWTVLSPLAYLGMTTGQTRYMGGLALPRMSSFLREPSLIPPVFLLPGALALTFKSRIRLWAIPIFAFALSGFAGSVYAPVTIALIFIVAMKLPLLGRRPAILSVAAFGIVVTMIFLIYRTTYIDDLLRVVFTFVSNREKSLGFLDKWGSANTRIYAAREFVAGGLEGGFDRPNIAIGAIGLILFSYARAGIVAALFMSWHLLRTFSVALRYGTSGKGSVIASGLVVGTFVQAGFLNTYGFFNTAGYLIMSLTVLRLRSMTPAHRHVPVPHRRRARRVPAYAG